MAVRNPDLDEEIIAYDRLQTDEINDLEVGVNNLEARIGYQLRLVAQGYGAGDVINQSLTSVGAIYVLVTGRWNSMHIISWDRGSNGLIRSTVLEDSRVAVSVSGANLTVHLTANGEYVLYRLK